MKKWLDVAVIVVLALTLTGCAVLGGGGLEPGDVVAGVNVVQDDGDDVLHGWDLEAQCSEVTGTGAYLCSLPLGTKVNVSFGVYGDVNTGADYQAVWEDHTYEMTINGRPVDLESFGYVDLSHPLVGAMRVWDVVLVADQLAEISVRSKGVISNEEFDEVITYQFGEP